MRLYRIKLRTADIAMTLHATNDFGLMTLDAAHEVDLRLAGAKPNIDVFRELARRLSEISGPPDRSGAAFLHADPRAIQVLARAMEDYSPNKIEDVGALISQIKTITEPLRADDSEVDAAKLRQVKQFCLSLHRALSAADVPNFHEWEYTSDGETAFD